MSGRGAPPRQVLISGDALVKAEKCAEDVCSVLRMQTSASYHQYMMNSCLKDVSNLDKTLASLQQNVKSMKSEIDTMRSQEVAIRSHAENSVEIIELLKRIEKINECD